MITQNSSEFASVSAEINFSEARLRLIIETIPVIAWCALAEGSGEFWNHRWRDYTGLPIEAARGGGWRAVIHPEDMDRIEDKWHADLTSGRAGEVEGHYGALTESIAGSCFGTSRCEIRSAISSTGMER